MKQLVKSNFVQSIAKLDNGLTLQHVPRVVEQVARREQELTFHLNMEAKLAQLLQKQFHATHITAQVRCHTFVS